MLWGYTVTVVTDGAFRMSGYPDAFTFTQQVRLKPLRYFSLHQDPLSSNSQRSLKVECSSVNSIMKLPFVALVLITAVVHARVALPSGTSLEYVTRNLGSNITLVGNTIVHTDADKSKYDKSTEIGRTLHSASKSKDSVARWFFKYFPNFADTCQSPFDGDGRKELRKWGFDDSDELSKDVEKECDFDNYHHIKSAFDELGLDARASKDGGPNHCFKINHLNGPAIKRDEDGSLPSEENQYYDVCGKTYKVSSYCVLKRSITNYIPGYRSHLRIRRQSRWDGRTDEHHEHVVLR